MVGMINMAGLLNQKAQPIYLQFKMEIYTMEFVAISGYEKI